MLLFARGVMRKIRMLPLLISAFIASKSSRLRKGRAFKYVLEFSSLVSAFSEDGASGFSSISDSSSFLGLWNSPKYGKSLLSRSYCITFVQLSVSLF